MIMSCGNQLHKSTRWHIKCVLNGMIIIFKSTLFYSSFFFFWLRWVFVYAHRLSLVAASGGYSLVRCMGFSLQWLFFLWLTGSRAQ